MLRAAGRVHRRHGEGGAHGGRPRRGGALSARRDARQRRGYFAHLAALRSELGDEPAQADARVLAGVHAALARAMDVPEGDGVVEHLARGARPVEPRLAEPPAPLATPYLLGEVHEALRARGDRRRAGAVYTPADVAARVVGWALAASERPRAPAVCDPAVGGGAFLIAAATALAGRGARRAAVLEQVFGADLDPTAVRVAEAALVLWSGTGSRPPAGALVVADAADLSPSSWTGAPGAGFDLVVGNPPFRGQLQARTARDGRERAAARRRFGHAAAPYADSAALLLVAACELARPGGVVAMLQPESFLAARDAGAVRRAVGERAALRGLWVAGGGLFDAGVRVCVPLLEIGGRSGTVDVRVGAELSSAGAADPAGLATAPTWSHLAAAAAGVPELPGLRGGRLGDLCEATADFRDQYYAVVRHLRDGPPAPVGRTAPVVTCGLIDPAVCRWGGRPARLGGRTLAEPRVDLDGLAADGFGAWVARRLVPKVVVATQTRVVEAAVDERGAWLPSTPVISVTAPASRLWHVAAALCSPVGTVWALRHHLGAGLAAGTVKLSARQVLDMPAPPEGPAWDRAAAALRAASSASGDAWRSALVEAGAATCDAFGAADEALVAWWAGRLPPWR